MVFILFLVPEKLPDPKIVRSNDGKDIDVTWDAIIPNRTKGEGYVYRYDIRYYQFDVSSSIEVEGKNTTHYKIMDVGENTKYTVQVRVVVINSTEPTLTYQFGTWGGEQIPQEAISELKIVKYILCSLWRAVLLNSIMWGNFLPKVCMCV